MLGKWDEGDIPCTAILGVTIISASLFAMKFYDLNYGKKAVIQGCEKYPEGTLEWWGCAVGTKPIDDARYARFEKFMENARSNAADKFIQIGQETEAKVQPLGECGVDVNCE